MIRGPANDRLLFVTPSNTPLGSATKTTTDNRAEIALASTLEMPAVNSGTSQTGGLHGRTVHKHDRDERSLASNGVEWQA